MILLGNIMTSRGFIVVNSTEYKQATLKFSRVAMVLPWRNHVLLRTTHCIFMKLYGKSCQSGWRGRSFYGLCEPFHHSLVEVLHCVANGSRTEKDSFGSNESIIKTWSRNFRKNCFECLSSVRLYISTLRHEPRTYPKS